MGQIYDIIVVNEASGCLNAVTNQYNITGCNQNIIVRFDGTNNAVGPFDIYVDSTGTTAVLSGVTRTEMIYGVVLTLSDSGAGCGPTPTPTVTPTVTPTDPMTGVTTTPTPTPTLTPTNTQTPSVTPTNTETPTNTPTSSQTPTVTPTNTVTPSITPSNTQTPSVTPTNTATPTVTPSETPTNTPTLTQTPTPTNLPFRGYIFPEPQDSTSQFDLGTYMSSFPSYTYAGFGNTGGYPAGPGYAADLNWYVQYSGWTGSNGNFITNVSTISNAIRQSSGTGTDSEGCSQNQYTFGSIGITTSMVNPNIQYVYSVWIPLAGVGGTFNNMTIDIGTGAACSTSIIDNGVPDSINAGINVTVPSGCAIPSGTYRVLWMNELNLIPNTTPLGTTIWVKGDTKS
jgi:hypothetical protein